MNFWQRLTTAVGTRRLLKVLRFYPPYLGAGIRVIHADAQLRQVEVEMRLTRWNQNYVGTHFGGSLYAMCDPFYMLMVIENLGPGHVVWDKAASIDFIKPGRGLVRARFTLSDEQLATIHAEVAQSGKSYPQFETTVVDEQGEVVARVGKLLSVRKKAA